MNSSLATYRNITQNQSGKRSAKIIGLTPHIMVAKWSGKQCADYFVDCYRTGRRASSNYCVGINGDIAVSVDEDCHAWTSANWNNDETHVTIECANLPDNSLTDVTYQALLKLSADICIRHGITPHYDKSAGVNSTITMHRDVTLSGSTSCPGDWLARKIISGEFERDILAVIGKTVQSDQLYRVRKSWDDSKSQVGAYSILENAKQKADETGLKVFNASGEQVYPFFNFCVKITVDALNVRKGPSTDYPIGTVVKKGEIYTIVSLDDTGQWGKLKSGVGWIYLDYTKKM